MYISKHIQNDGVETWCDMLIVTKIVDPPIGRTKLFKALREKGVLMEGNIPYQQYVDNKLFKMELKPRYKANGHVAQWYAVTLVSGKGVELIKKIVEQIKKEANIGSK
jgi:phage antirepressor YoqD-like protein